MSKSGKPSARALHCVSVHPLRFVLLVCKAFGDNQGLLLAGAIAFYALLSIVLLLILVTIAFNHFVRERLLLDTRAHLLQWLMPGQFESMVAELEHFLANRSVIDWYLVVTIIFFSSLALTVLEMHCQSSSCTQTFPAVGDLVSGWFGSNLVSALTMSRLRSTTPLA